MSLMMRTFVVAMMLASASSFAPSPKTQLATRRPAQAPPRVMPAMKVTYRSPMYYIGFPSQYQKDAESDKVCPYHCARLHLWHAHRTELVPTPSACTAPFRMHVPDSCAPGAPRLPGAPPPPRSPIPSLEPAPTICAVTNTTISQSPSPPLPRLRRRMRCERVTSLPCRLHTHRLCVCQDGTHASRAIAFMLIFFKVR